MSSYNSSYYNIWERTEEGYIVYNTLHGSSALLSGKEYNRLMKGEIDKFSEEDLQTLESLHIIGKDLTAAKEREILREYIEKERKNPSVMTFTIAPTYRCNLACTYCYQNESNIEMDEEYVEATINFIKNMTTLKGCKSIVPFLYGGEPLLCPKTCFKILEEIKDWADKEDISVHSAIVTNATLLSKEIIKRFKSYNVAVLLTLDGPKRIHDQRRKYKDGKGTYDDIIKAIKMLEEEGVHTNVRINIDKDNVGHIDELFCDLEKENFSTFKNVELYFSPLFPWPKPKFKGDKYLDNTFLDGNRYHSIFAKKANAYGMPLHKAKVQRFNCVNCPPCISMLDKLFVVSPDRRIYQCIYWMQCEEVCSGHIDKYGNFEKSKTYFELRNRDPFTFDKCKKCKLFPICLGGCCVGAYYRYKRLDRPFCMISTDFVLEKNVEVFHDK